MNPSKRISRGDHGPMKLYLGDEARPIGCGWRKCMVRIGNKRAKLTELASGRKKTLPRAIFDRIEEASTRLGYGRLDL